MISETASAEGTDPLMKANWIISLGDYLKSHPEIKAIIWFNIEDNGINWRIDSAKLSENAFKESFTDYFIYDYEVQN